MRELREGKYTAPSGKEIVFGWETLSRGTELKTGTYTFPARDGAHVQHQGRGAMTFPLTCVFTGENCIEDADAFEKVLYEKGDAELQHPLYGTFKVKPTGNISREDDPVARAGESKVTVTFTETISGEEIGELSAAAADSVDALNEEFAGAIAEDFAENAASVKTTSGQIAVKAVLKTQTQIIIDALRTMAASDKKVFAGWQETAKELEDSILKAAAAAGNKREEALTAARLTLRVMNQPARLAASRASKTQSYSNIAEKLIEQYKSAAPNIKKIKNIYAAAWLGIAGVLAALASGTAISIAQAAASSAGGAAAGKRGDYSAPNSGLFAGVSTREEAVETASAILALQEKTNVFWDSVVSQNVFEDANPESYTALLGLVSRSVQLIMNAAFALPMQKTFTLDRDRQIIELCAELYGSPDYLDNFIIQNNFSVDEIEVLPMGTKVSCYVQSA